MKPIKRVWLGLALLSGSWLMGLSYYCKANWAAWAVLVIAGTVLLAGSPLVRAGGRLAAVAVCLLLAPGAVILPWPYRAAPLLIIAGLALQVAPVLRSWPRRLGAGCAAAGAVLMVQAVLVTGYEAFTAPSHDLPRPLAWVLAQAAGLLGVESALDGANVCLFSMRRIHPLGATWELLLDPPTACFLVGAVVLILLGGLGGAKAEGAAWRRARAGLGLVAAIILWLPVRSALLMAVYLHRVLRTEFEDPLGGVNQFWSPWVHLVLLAGPVALAWWLVPRGPGPADEPAAAPAPSVLRRVRTALAGVLALASAGAIAFAVLSDPPGERKAGRILVDEYHCQIPWPGKTFDTTSTTRPFDTEWYGHDSAYNYACIYDYCTRFYQMSRLERRIDEAALRDCDVLLLKVPSGPSFRAEEVIAVRDFVQRGGGLLLMGEHTAVYGSGMFINRIAREFGFAFRYDCAFGIDSVFEQKYRPPLVAHPIVQEIPWMTFATSCTIEPHGRGQAAIRSTGLKNSLADYHVVNFYPQAVDQPDMRYGAFVQLWAVRHGAGRVVAFSDSTIFANFSTFESGKRELFMGMMEWLNHRNGDSDPRPALAVAGWAMGLGALLLAWPWSANWAALMAAGLLGWVFAAAGARAANRAAMPPPPPPSKPLRPMVRVAVDRAISDVRLPVNGFIAGNQTDFGQFERSILRVGYFTFRAPATEALDADMIVMLHPNVMPQALPPGYLELVKRYVEKGGRLLVLDSPENGKSSAGVMLAPFGLGIKRPMMTTTKLAGDLAVPEGWPAIRVTSSGEVEGGVPLARLAGRPVAAWTRFGEGKGKGLVVVIAFGSRFTDNNMGFVGDVVPNADLRKVFDYEFTLLRAMIEDKLPAKPTFVAPPPAPSPAPTTMPRSPATMPSRPAPGIRRPAQQPGG